MKTRETGGIGTRRGSAWASRLAGVALAFALALGAGRGARAEADYLREAVRNDAAMKDAAVDLESIAREMETSNVFTPAVIASNRDVAARVAASRDGDMRGVLRVLEQSLQDATNRTAYFTSARDGHRRVSRTLTTLADRLAAAANQADALLAKVQALARDTRDLAQEVDKTDKGPNADQQQRADDLARDIRDTKKQVSNPEAAKHMDKAADQLQAGKPDPAAAEMKQAADLLAQDSQARENAVAAAAAKEDALQKASADLAQLAKDADKLARAPDTAKAADKAMDMMMKADETAKTLDQAQATNAAVDARSGENNLQNAQYDQASQAFRQASAEAAQAAAQVAAEMQKAIEQQGQAINQMASTANQMAALQGMKDRTDALAQENKAATEPSPQTPQGTMPESKAAPLAGKMDQLAKDMQAGGVPEPAKDVGDAKQDTDKGQHADAQKSLEAASGKLAEALQAAQQKMNELMAQAAGPQAPPWPPGPPEPPGPPQPGQMPGQEAAQQASEKAFSAAAAAAGGMTNNAAWRSTLPERDRQALLSGRQEKNSPAMDDDVKRYFETLAE